MITLTAKIYISETEIIEIDQRNLLSLESSIFDRSDLKLPSFGIISNVGNIEFNDIDGKVLQYAEQLRLVEGLQCEIYLTNTLVEGARELVAKMETDQWDYDNDNRVVSVSLKDDLEYWQEINVAPINYDPRNPIESAINYIYNHLAKVTRDKGYSILSFSELDEETKNVMLNTYLKYLLLKEGTLWQQWEKLCYACQLHIYKDSNGIVTCRYNGGN